MRERRRIPRISLKASITDIQSLYISKGTIINISEKGIRYSKPLDKQITKETFSQNDAATLTVRTIYFSLPEHGLSLQLVCHVRDERINENYIEASCVFLGITNDEKQKIRAYINKSIHHTQLKSSTATLIKPT